MGWIKEPKPPCYHTDRPKLNVYKKHMVGGIYKCDDCEETFIIDEEEFEDGTQWGDKWVSMKLIWKVYIPPVPEYHSYLRR